MIKAIRHIGISAKELAEFVVSSNPDSRISELLSDALIENSEETTGRLMEIFEDLDKAQALLPASVDGSSPIQRDYVNGSPLKDVLRYRKTPKAIFASVEYSVLKREPGTTAFTWVRKEEKAQLRPYEAVLLWMEFAKTTPIFEQKYTKIKHW
jgi:hypothetical protein